MAGDDSRKKALEALKKQIAEQRARIDPEVLRRTREAIAAQNTAPAPETVPYDKGQAQAAVELFLKSHTDAKSFGVKLAALIRKEQN
jgi:hypothetical protein